MAPKAANSATLTDTQSPTPRPLALALISPMALSAVSLQHHMPCRLLLCHRKASCIDRCSKSLLLVDSSTRRDTRGTADMREIRVPSNFAPAELLLYAHNASTHTNGTIKPCNHALPQGTTMHRSPNAMWMKRRLSRCHTFSADGVHELMVRTDAGSPTCAMPSIPAIGVARWPPWRTTAASGLTRPLSALPTPLHVTHAPSAILIDIVSSIG
jgi:hypothetical protein